jgi:serine/threonine-protein kinase
VEPFVAFGGVFGIGFMRFAPVEELSLQAERLHLRYRMKICPNCKSKYPEDANFCPLETCATADGPQRLEPVPEAPEPRFKPIERIGGGSTGEVWRARDGQTGTEVALKLVNREVLGSPAAQSRAEREFKQLMRVSSPRVATIIDCGRLPDQRLFVAMELFPGESLASVLRSGPVDLENAKAMVGQVGQALLEAQKAGLVHRDVSPKNVLVGPSGDVKVINFPLAKPATDKVAGDPAYLSSEQAQGKPADQRSNTYSLAAILYHMLTGEPPFQAATPQAVLDMHVSSPLLPPSQRRPDAGISVEMDRLVLKAMDKSSSRRHLTLRLFLTELEGVKAAAPGAAASGAGKPGGDVGLAKTMLFAGNQADIARMVSEATAAKAAASAAPARSEPAAPARGASVAAKPSPKAPPPPDDEPTISVMDTMAVDSMAPAAPAQPAPAAPSKPVAPAPAARPVSPPAAARAAAPAPKPAPAQQQQASAAQRPAAPSLGGGVIKPAEAGKAPPPKPGAAFRETLWFKKGDVDQMVADAKAKQAATGKPAGEEELPTDDARPLEDRYVDDGSVTTEDRKKFSLRTGRTSTALPTAGAAIPGEQMDERELVQEIGRGRRTAILLVAAVVIVALFVVVAMMMKGKGSKAHSTQTVPPAAAAAVTPPPAAIPPAPAAPAAPAIPAPTAPTIPSPPVPAAAPPPAAPAAAAGLGAADDAAQPRAGGAVSGAEQAAGAGNKPAKAKAPHRGKAGKKKH